MIYSLDIKKMIDSGERVNIIGMQPLLRPFKQKACSILLAIKDNLNTKSYIAYTKIKVDKKEAIRYYEMFDGGRALFPDEVVNNKVYEIKKSKVIDREVVDFMFRNNIFPKNVNNEKDLMQLLKGEKIEVTDKTTELSFSQNETSTMINRWRETEKVLMAKIRLRGVADPV